MGTLNDIDKVMLMARSRSIFVNNCSPRPEDKVTIHKCVRSEIGSLHVIVP